jgi:hypothetical protein
MLGYKTQQDVVSPGQRHAFKKVKRRDLFLSARVPPLAARVPYGVSPVPWTARGIGVFDQSSVPSLEQHHLVRHLDRQGRKTNLGSFTACLPCLDALS